MPTFARLCLALTVIWFPNARGSRGSRLDSHVFLEYCQRFRGGFKARADDLNPATTLGEVHYQRTHLLDATQLTYNFWKMRNSMRRALGKRSGNFYDKELMHWRFGHDLDECGVGRSLFPPEKFLIGVLWRNNRIYLFDGHHKGLTSSYLFASTVPVKLMADWSDLSFPEFVARMSHVTNGQRHAYWQDYLGNPVEPVDLGHLINDPNLLLARKLLQRVDAFILVHPDQTEELVIERLGKADNVLAIKIGNDESFFEVRQAYALRRHGIVFDEHRRGEPLAKREMVEYLDILKRERDGAGSDLKNVLLLDKPRPAFKIDHVELIMNHVRERNCAHLLERRVHTLDRHAH